MKNLADETLLRLADFEDLFEVTAGRPFPGEAAPLEHPELTDDHILIGAELEGYTGVSNGRPLGLASGNEAAADEAKQGEARVLEMLPPPRRTAREKRRLA